MRLSRRGVVLLHRRISLFLPGAELGVPKIYYWNREKRFASFWRSHKIILWGSCDLKMYIYLKIIPLYFVKSIKINCNQCRTKEWPTFGTTRITGPPPLSYTSPTPHMLYIKKKYWIQNVVFQVKFSKT